jgi:hypothetical protein
LDFEDAYVADYCFLKRFSKDWGRAALIRVPQIIMDMAVNELANMEKTLNEPFERV